MSGTDARIAALKTALAERERCLAEALPRQTATSRVLDVSASSSAE